jgi:hypothetical protein
MAQMALKVSTAGDFHVLASANYENGAGILLGQKIHGKALAPPPLICVIGEICGFNFGV